MGFEERVLAQLLSEIDGINDSGGVFVVGCTNRPLSDIDEAMLRPGRLEVLKEVLMFYITCFYICSGINY